MTVKGTLKEGYVISKETTDHGVVAAGAVALNVSFPDLKHIEYILQVQFDTDPDVNLNGPAQDKVITGNVVGMTLQNVAAGTTLSSTVIAVGPP